MQPFFSKIKTTLTILTLIGASSLAYSKECPETNLADLSERFAGKGRIEIIFFASWCSSCLKHLEEPHRENTIFVAVFDNKSSAQKVLDTFKVKNQCFISSSLAAEWDVRELPAIRYLTLEKN